MEIRGLLESRRRGEPRGRPAIERMVELGRVSRSGFYRTQTKPETSPDQDVDLRDAIQRVGLHRSPPLRHRRRSEC